MMENLLDVREKWINKGTDKLETDDSQLHNTICGIQGLYLN